MRSGPFLFEKYGICGGVSPFWTATSPDGTFVAVSYWKGSNNCLGGSYTPSVRLTNRNDPTFGTGTYPSYDYLNRPHWIRHPDQRPAGIEGNTLKVWQNDAAHMQDWITVSGGLELDDFDFHPTETKLLLDLAEPGTGVKPHTLALLTYTELSAGGAAPTDPAPQFVCSADAYVTNDLGGGRPVWSPDGSQIAWTGPAGIYVSSAPVPAGETCLLSPQLVVPGGREAHWATFDLADPAAAPSANAPTTPAPAPGAPTSGPTTKPAGGGGTTKASAPAFSAAKSSRESAPSPSRRSSPRPRPYGSRSPARAPRNRSAPSPSRPRRAPSAAPSQRSAERACAPDATSPRSRPGRRRRPSPSRCQGADALSRETGPGAPMHELSLPWQGQLVHRVLVSGACGALLGP